MNQLCLISMIKKNKFVICSSLIIILIVCIISAGCTSHQTQTSTQSNSSIITTPTQALSSTKTVPAANVSLAATLINSGLTVTLNSAVKKTNIEGLTPKPGNIFLVLNVTIQNNDKNNDFEYTDASFLIFDKLNLNRSSAITSTIAAKLNSPIPASGRIPPASKNTGEIVFGVMDNSNSYKFSVDDKKGTVLTSIDNINVP